MLFVSPCEANFRVGLQTYAITAPLNARQGIKRRCVTNKLKTSTYILNKTRLQARNTLYLGSYVVRCSTEGLGSDAVIHIFFTHAKICYLNVTLAVQHHIVQLQVSTGGKSNISNTRFMTQHGPRRLIVAPFSLFHATVFFSSASLLLLFLRSLIGNDAVLNARGRTGVTLKQMTDPDLQLGGLHYLWGWILSVRLYTAGTS